LGSKMSLCRRKVARVALGVPLEDDLYWTLHQKDEYRECLDDIEALRTLASSEEPTLYCIEAATLVELGHSNKCTREQSDHLVSCMRCARIGQYIANMPAKAKHEVRPLSLIA